METKRIVLSTDTQPPEVLVRVDAGKGEKQFRFTTSFRIGRDPDCPVPIDDAVVSREHLEVVFEGGRWWIRDLGSTNGTFLKGERIDLVPFVDSATITLGPEGPVVRLKVEGEHLAEQTITQTVIQAAGRFGRIVAERSEAARQQTQDVMRRAVRMALKTQARRYWKIVAGLGVVAVFAVVYAYYSHTELAKQRILAEEVFYEMKGLELALSRLELALAASPDSALRAEAERLRDRQNDLASSYDRYISELGVYSEDMNEKERVVYRVARIFGECELGMPEGFSKEVLRYVGEWRKSPMLRRAVTKAHDMGYVPIISTQLLHNHLPPQFFYLALKESEFDSSICGPPTRFGIAKGMWQFIPATAIQYGLRTGPLVHLPKPDPRDERHDVQKSSEAAARYLRDIYSTEAQASGLLVLASYNWGHNIVRSLVRELPENPRERNFWKFLHTHRERLPKQTYDYVFYIIAAAVIGEQPRLFGFEFDNPLAPERVTIAGPS